MPYTNTSIFPWMGPKKSPETYALTENSQSKSQTRMYLRTSERSFFKAVSQCPQPYSDPRARATRFSKPAGVEMPATSSAVTVTPHFSAIAA